MNKSETILEEKTVFAGSPNILKTLTSPLGSLRPCYRYTKTSSLEVCGLFWDPKHIFQCKSFHRHRQRHLHRSPTAFLKLGYKMEINFFKLYYIS